MKHRYITIKIDIDRSIDRTSGKTLCTDEFWDITIIESKIKNETGWALKASGEIGKDLRKILKQIKERLYL